MSKILIVDDETAIVDGLKTMLTAFGYEVLTAENGETAVEITQQEKPDIMLLDICFPEPGIDGIQALKKIREFNKDVKVILTSGLGVEARKMDEANTLGISKFMSKPLNVSELRASINEILTSS